LTNLARYAVKGIRKNRRCGSRRCANVSPDETGKRDNSYPEPMRGVRQSQRRRSHLQLSVTWTLILGFY